MKLKNILLLASCIFFSTGCAHYSAIQDADKSESEFNRAAIYNGQRTQVQKPINGLQQHRIFHQGSSGFTPVSAVRNSAMSRATEFCDRNDKKPYLVEEATSKPPHILGNWPRVELVFSCIERKQQKVAIDKYERLARLKQLLDDGAITTQEYKLEKSRLGFTTSKAPDNANEDREFTMCLLDRGVNPIDIAKADYEYCLRTAGVADPGQTLRLEAGNHWRQCLSSSAAKWDDGISSVNEISQVVVSFCATEWRGYVNSLWMPPETKEIMAGNMIKYGISDGSKAVLLTRREQKNVE